MVNTGCSDMSTENQNLLLPKKRPFFFCEVFFNVFSTPKKWRTSFFWKKNKSKVSNKNLPSVFSVHRFFQAQGDTAQTRQTWSKTCCTHRCCRPWVVWNCEIMVRPSWQRQTLSATRGQQKSPPSDAISAANGLQRLSVLSDEFSRDLIQGLCAFYVQICLILRDSGWILWVLFSTGFPCQQKIAAFKKHQHSWESWCRLPKFDNYWWVMHLDSQKTFEAETTTKNPQQKVSDIRIFYKIFCVFLWIRQVFRFFFFSDFNWKPSEHTSTARSFLFQLPRLKSGPSDDLCVCVLAFFIPPVFFRNEKNIGRLTTHLNGGLTLCGSENNKFACAHLYPVLRSWIF